MKSIRLIIVGCLVASGSYFALDYRDQLMDWLLGPTPEPQVRLIEPESEPAPVEADQVKATEVDAPAPMQADVSPKVATPKPVSPKEMPVAAPKIAVQVTSSEHVAPVEPIKPSPGIESLSAARAPSLPERASRVDAAAVEPVKDLVLKPVDPAPVEPVKEEVKAASKVAPVVAVSDVLPLTPEPAAAQNKDAVSKPKLSTDKSKEIQLTIKDIQFTGVTVFPVQELSKVVNEFVGKELTVQEAFAIPAKVTQHYKSQNRMAIATLVGAITPDGVLTVGVVEMQMSQSQAEKELTTMASPAALPIKAKPATVEPVVLQKDSESETDYILKNYANKSRQYELLADNYGPDATGRGRLGASFSYDEDKLSLVGLKSQGSDYFRVAVRWATGLEGVKIGANLSKLNYEVINHLEDAVYQSGDAVKKGVEVIYQLFNQPGHISTLGLQYVKKSINSLGINAADSSSLSTHVSSLEWKGLIREMVPGGAVFSYDTSYSRGQLSNSGSSVMSGLDVPDGVFAKLRFDGTVLQPLGGLGSVFARLTLQKSDVNLDPSERLYLGGPLGVRAYGVGQGVGSQGGIFSLEFRQRLDASTSVSEFYDWGSVRQVNDVNPSTVLKGYGLGLSHDMGDGLTLKGTWARSSGNTPDPSTPQNNDGQYDRNRFWLSIESRF